MSENVAETTDFIIVGGGLAGLSCAMTLHQSGHSFVLLESSNRFGGKLRSEEKEGFILDAGFQVFLSSYPTARRLLDFKALDLKPFMSGAMVYDLDGQFYPLLNPLKHPFSALKTLSAPFLTLKDALLSLRMLWNARQAVESKTGLSTLEGLQQLGFSQNFLEQFWFPFYRGVMLENSLETDFSQCLFTCRHFASGKATLPSRGMRAIPEQLQSGLPAHALKTGQSVTCLEGLTVKTLTGQTYTANKQIILALPLAQLAEIAGALPEGVTVPEVPTTSTTTFYFSMTKLPEGVKPLLYLNGKRGEHVRQSPASQQYQWINHLCFPSMIAPELAPPHRHLCSVSVIGSPPMAPETLEYKVRQELVDWFGNSTRDWQLLETMTITDSFPISTARYGPYAEAIQKLIETSPYPLCGDWNEFVSIEGAMASGVQAAKQAISNCPALVLTVS